MGSYIELNDTLQITTEQGFPVELDLRKHKEVPFTVDDFENKVFEFQKKPGARVYHIPPNRNFLVHNTEGKWLYWGKILIIEQTIQREEGRQTTSGKFKIIEIFDPKYQEHTKHNSPEDLSYF
ncbi:MAG: hypothetical protein ABIJ92_01780 [Candidatus Aenigmatarchaeota archaeon]